MRDYSAFQGDDRLSSRQGCCDLVTDVKGILHLRILSQAHSPGGKWSVPPT